MPTIGRQGASKGTLLPNAPGSAFTSRKGAYILVDGAKYYRGGSAWVENQLLVDNASMSGCEDSYDGFS